MDGAKRILTDCLGSDGLQTLEKSIIRLKTNSTADAMEMYLPLLVVPRAILSWLVQNILPIPVGEYRELKFPGQDDTSIHIEKADSDVYHGEFSRGGKIIHRFNHQTLPAVSGHLMTIFELYHDIEKESMPSGDKKPSFDMVSEIMSRNNVTIPKPNDNVTELVSAISKLVDALVLQNISRPAIVPVIQQPEAEPKKEAPVEEVKKDEVPCVTPKSGYFKKKIESLKKQPMQKGFSGSAVPTPPKGPTPPVGPSNNPMEQRNKQLKAAANGKDSKTVGATKTPNAAPKGPTAPKMATPKLPTAPKLPTLKSENYFKNKLSKVSKSEHFCTEEQVYQKCKFCDESEFQKSEVGPVYSPCACYQQTLKSKGAFVTLRKSGNGYRLSFNTDDKDAIASFLKTLRQ